MNKTQPILSCAGRESVAIDTELLNELLLSFKPNLIGIKEKARIIRDFMGLICQGEYDSEGTTAVQFKSIINREFLQLQLMEAATLARTGSEDTEAILEVEL